MGKADKHIVEFISEFCLLPRPSTSQKSQLTDLIIANLDRFDYKTIKKICHMLSSSHHVPNRLIEKLCTLPAHTCHALLISSTCLKEENFIRIIDMQSIDHARIIARHSRLTSMVVLQLRSLNDKRVDRSIELRQKPKQKKCPAPVQHSAKTKQNKTAISADMFFKTLAEESIDGLIYTALSDHTGLSVSSIRTLCSDVTSKNLPIFLKYININLDTAWTFYVRFAKSFSYEPGVEDAFRFAFTNIDYLEAKRVFQGWVMDDLLIAVRYGVPANQDIYGAAQPGKIA